MEVLVLQHIACEPPGVYEDVLHEHGATIHRVELDEGDPLPDWHGFDANQAFRVGTAAYGVQFHLEVSSGLAREWALVPAYAESLERVLGPGALDRLVAELEASADGVLSHGRHLFERWLGAAAKLPGLRKRERQDV